MPHTGPTTSGGGRNLTFIPVNQTAAATTTLIAAVADLKHKILGAILTMSAAGTLKFTDGVDDIIGPLDIDVRGGLVAPSGIFPYAETGAANRALILTTTVGAARGVVIVATES